MPARPPEALAPALPAWEEEGALHEVVRLARGLPYEDFDRAVLPRLLRLTQAQRALALVALTPGPA